MSWIIEATGGGRTRYIGLADGTPYLTSAQATAAIPQVQRDPALLQQLGLPATATLSAKALPSKVEIRGMPS